MIINEAELYIIKTIAPQQDMVFGTLKRGLAPKKSSQVIEIVPSLTNEFINQAWGDAVK